MNRYEPGTPRTALGLAAIALTALTVGLLVVVPAKMEVSPDALTMARIQGRTPADRSGDHAGPHRSGRRARPRGGGRRRRRDPAEGQAGELSPPALQTRRAGRQASGPSPLRAPYLTSGIVGRDVVGLHRADLVLELEVARRLLVRQRAHHAVVQRSPGPDLGFVRRDQFVGEVPAHAGRRSACRCRSALRRPRRAGGSPRRARADRRCRRARTSPPRRR